MSHRLFLAAAVLVVGSAVGLVAAQDQKAKAQTALGVVTAVTGDSLSLDTGKGVMQFSTSDVTRVEVVGGSSKTRAAKEAGQKGIRITDAVHQGDQVSVKYTQAGGKMVASEIDVRTRRPQSAQPPK